MAKKALFLDRDGTIIIDRNYPSDPGEVAFIPGVPDSLRKAQKEYLLIVISNQSGVGRGLITPEQFEKVNQQFRSLLEKEKIDIAGFYYCIHAPEQDCGCRKPKPGMILEAAGRFDIDLSESYMIGDKQSDVEAGLRAGCRVIRVQGSGWSAYDSPDPSGVQGSEGAGWSACDSPDPSGVQGSDDAQGSDGTGWSACDSPDPSGVQGSGGAGGADLNRAIASILSGEG